MALNFDIIKLEKEDGGYVARVLFDDFIGDYKVRAEAHLSYLPYLSENLRFHILTKEDTSFNGQLPRIKVRGLTPKARIRERALEEALLEFVKENSRD
jgi:hypothetical protein